MKISLTFHALLGAACIMPRAAAQTDLDSVGSFDALSIDPLAEDGDGFSLTTSYSPINTTTSRIIQVYVNNNGPDISGAQNSCPSVNADALKIGNDIDQAAIVTAAGGAFTQAAGLDIANTIDLGASAAGTIKLPFTFTNAISTDPTTKLYLETDAGTGARIQFCVREKLQLLSGQVVDVMEVPLDFTVNLEGAIELTGGFEIKSVAEETQDLSSTYAVDIYQCDLAVDPTVEIKPEYNQGDIVELCIRSSDYPQASVIDITALAFTLGDNTYNAIIGSNEAALTDFDPDTDCNTHSNVGGQTEQICGVRALLPIDTFFAAGTADGNSRNVEVTGMALLGIGGRRLAVGGSLRRELQGGDQEATFSTTFDIGIPENDDSGGFSMSVASTGAVAVAIAAWLI